MSRYLALLEHLKTLEAESARIRAEGLMLSECWIAESKPGGTARTDNAHYQLRSRKPMFGGKKSKYLRASEVGFYRDAIARGRKFQFLKNQISQIQRQIDRVEALISVEKRCQT